MASKIIAYYVYPGDSARWFPNIQSVIFVKPDLFQKWRRDQKSVDFKDVLIDPQNPVKYFTTSAKERPVDQVAPDYLHSWYQTADPMEIALKTAQYGREKHFNEEYMKESIIWTPAMDLWMIY